MKLSNKLAYTLLLVVVISTVLSTLAFFHVMQTSEVTLPAEPTYGKVSIQIIEDKEPQIAQQNAFVTIKFDEVEK